MSAFFPVLLNDRTLQAAPSRFPRDPSMPIASDEVFGPVVSVMTFETLDEAIDLANATRYGLSASVWSRDAGTALGVGRGVRAGTAGTARLNCRSVNAVSRVLDGSPDLALSPIIPRKKHFTFTKSAHELMAPHGPDLNQKDRKSTQGF